MTTIVGIKTNIGIDSVVLGSDTQLSNLDDDGNIISKTIRLKIVYGDFWALAPYGAYTDDLKSFYNKLKNPDDKRYKNFDKHTLEAMITKAIGKKRFMEIDELNANYLRDGGDLDQTHEFLMAVNKPRIELFYIDPFGNLIPPEKSKGYIILGAGKEEIQKYIKEQLEGDTYDSENVDLKKAMDLCRNSVKKVSQKGDISSGWPIDIAIIRKGSIRVYGRRIKDAIEKADDDEWEKIKNEEREH